MKRLLVISGIVVSFFIFWKAVDQYSLCPRYTFSSPSPFKGNSIFNPYEQVNWSNAAAANFHAHASTWSGLTNGSGTASDIYRRYDSMGYAYHAISQYHFVDTFGFGKPAYVPAYEHGYNVTKTHQLVLGAKSVLWKDYIFPQTIHNKQEVLVRLAKDTGNVIVLNHPSLRSGYTLDEMRQLEYYDYIELLNPSAESIRHWDEMLSSGKSIFAMGNDDMHDVFNNDQLGRFFTLLYGESDSHSNVMKSLKKGAGITVWLPQVDNESLEEKARKVSLTKSLIRSMVANDDSMVLELAEPIKEIKLVTDHGRVKQIANSTAFFTFRFLQGESYWRIELIDRYGIRYFLNPLYRTTGGQMLARNEAGKLHVGRDMRPDLSAGIFFMGFFVVLMVSGWRFLVSIVRKDFRPARKIKWTN